MLAGVRSRSLTCGLTYKLVIGYAPLTIYQQSVARANKLIK